MRLMALCSKYRVSSPVTQPAILSLKTMREADKTIGGFKICKLVNWQLAYRNEEAAAYKRKDPMLIEVRYHRYLVLNQYLYHNLKISKYHSFIYLQQ